MKQILLLLSLFTINIYAQIDFEAHVTVDDTDGTNNPTSVYAADIDGDGDFDIISASHNDTKIAWYENTDGQGNYGAQQIISETLDPYSVFAADLDGDGDNDVLAASVTGDTVGWFKNLDGQGNFGTYQPISIITDGATVVYAFDADGDGDIDVFSTSTGDHKIAWYENLDGQGNFGSQQVISTDYDLPFYLTSGDIDGDGYMDIISGNGYFNGNIVWFKNTDGQGNFVEQQILTTDVNRCRSAVLVDIDGDGDLDIAAVSLKNSLAPAAIWFENTNGQGNFNNTPNLISDLDSVYAIFAGDFDNDGDADIAVGSERTGINWFKNNGSGNFGSKQIIDADVLDVNTLFAADIDNDGDSDLLMAAGSADRVAWHKNTNGQGNFGPAIEMAAINGANGPRQVITADLDGDGDKDIIAALSNGKRIVWQENLDGQGTFSELKTIAISAVPWAVYPGDINGDGFIDIVVATADRDEPLVWYKNLDGQGNFGTSQFIYDSPFSYTEAVYLTDIDNDGDLDIFSYENANFFWVENLDGLGNFSNAKLISDEFALTDSFTAADFDGDGDKDIVASYWGDGTVVWFENLDGQGDFDSGNIIDALNSADSVDVADIDNDGDMDVVTVEAGNDKVIWYENTNGQGTFGNANIISNTVTAAFSVYTKDLDNDGNVDVICSAYTTGEIIWFKNDGNGNFNYQQVISSNVRRPISVFADDFNGDGKMDVLACSFYYDQIIWFENKGPLGIEENTTNYFSIYPNPTNGVLNIKSATPLSEITVYNNLGQLLFVSEKNNQVDISTLSQGIYFVKIKDENGQTETKKVVKK